MELLITTLDLAKEARRIEDWRLMNLLSHPQAGGLNHGHRYDQRQRSGQGVSRVSSTMTAKLTVQQGDTRYYKSLFQP